MGTLLVDLRYALRQLRHNPAFALLAITVLALGIGTSTAMCTVLRGVLFRPVPFPHPRSLVAIQEPRGPVSSFWNVEKRDFRDWQRTQHSLDQLAWHEGGMGTVEAPGGAQRINHDAVSANFFATLGVRPMLGRDFTATDEKQQTRTVILSYLVWHSAFHDDPSILGRSVRLDKLAYHVIGIMPRGFTFPLWDDVAVYTPPGSGPTAGQDDFPSLDVIGRLHSGVSITQAQAELSAIQANIARTRTSKEGPPADHVLIRRWWDTVVGDVRPALLAFAAAVLLVWLVACANVASLQLTRNSARERELAVRSALGAARSRIVRQLLTEGLLLSAMASLFGLGLSIGLLRIIQHTLLRSIATGASAFHIDAAVLAAIVTLTFASTLLFGLLPAVSAARSSAQQGLQARAATATRRQNRLRDILIAAELSVTVLLLVASGLLLRSLQDLHHVPLGFRTDNILTTSMTIEPGRYDKTSANTALFDPLMTRLRQLPGVESVAISSTMPLDNSFTMSGMFDITGRKAARPQDKPQGNLRFASPDFPATFGIAVERGRFFRQGLDTPDSQPVVVVNHAFAARYLRGIDPLTAHIDIGDKAPWSGVPIVGVLADTHDDSIAGQPSPAIYLSTTQLGPKNNFNAVAASFAQVAVRTRTPLDLTESIHHVLREVAPQIPLTDVQTMQQIVADSLGSQTLAARLISLFAAATLLIAVVGLYGLIAYSVRQRTREIGVRMALGAQRSQVVALFLRRALTLVASGLAIGLVASLFATRLLRSYLYGVRSSDPVTLAAVSFLLLLCAGLAAWLPSHRAATIDPSQALRAE